MISLPGVPPVPGVHDAAPLKEATAAKQQQRTVQQQQETLAQKPQPNEPVHKVKIICIKTLVCSYFVIYRSLCLSKIITEDGGGKR